jgi:hypothetical protein
MSSRDKCPTTLIYKNTTHYRRIRSSPKTLNTTFRSTESMKRSSENLQKIIKSQTHLSKASRAFLHHGNCNNRSRTLPKSRRKALNQKRNVRSLRRNTRGSSRQSCAKTGRRRAPATLATNAATPTERMS